MVLNRRKIFTAVLFAALAAVFLYAGVFSVRAEEKPEAAMRTSGAVYLENIDVTGMSRDEVQAVIDKKMEKYGQDIIEIYAPEATYQYTAQELGIYYANTDLADIISTVGMNGNVLARYRIENYIRENGAVYFSLDLRVTPEMVYNAVADSCVHLNLAPMNMKLGKDEKGEFYTIPKKDGYHVMVDETANIMYEYLCTAWHGGVGAVQAVTEVDEAVGAVGDDVKMMTSVLGTGFTNYETTGKYENRAKNIANASAKINGTILYPGDEFSTEAALLPFTEENGYFYAPGYENGYVVDTIGGGVCQVSSTLYRAVLEAELEVTERYQHSMLVSYVEPSMDATIAEGSLDFKFKNSTDAPIYIESWAKDGTVYFGIVGHETRPAGRTLGFESEILSREKAGVAYTLDSSLDYGTIKFEDSHDGLSGAAYKIVYQDGVEVSREHISSSKYVKADGLCRVGIRNAPQAAVDALNSALASKNMSEIYLLSGLDIWGDPDGSLSLDDAKLIVQVSEGRAFSSDEYILGMAQQVVAFNANANGESVEDAVAQWWSMINQLAPPEPTPTPEQQAAEQAAQQAAEQAAQQAAEQQAAQQAAEQQAAEQQAAEQQATEQQAAEQQAAEQQTENPPAEQQTENPPAEQPEG
ncbi:MAG: VanW family protein [Lachnospiraceae bacterium]|nr:VanW family protein [Lachnospiraceae bacterium]